MSTVKHERVGFAPDRLQRINRLLQGYVERVELAGMLAAIARCGETVYLEKFGWMDIESAQPMRLDAIFRIASMSKPITAAAIMTLYEEGHFHLNTPISKFIPEFKDTKVFVRETGPDGEMEVADLEREITFRHLFTHTAGLSYGSNNQDAVDRAYQATQKRLEKEGIAATNENLAVELARLPLAFQPGAKWRYSYSIDILGRLIEVISGMSFGEFLRQRLFEPLGMVDTGFFVPESKISRVATMYGHLNQEAKLQRIDRSPETTPPTFESGGGGLLSTLNDYSRFAQMLVNGGELEGVRVLSPTTVAMFSMNQAPAQVLPYRWSPADISQSGYGFSLGTRVLMDVAQTGMAGSVGEFGWSGAFNTYFWVDPKLQLYGLLLMQHDHDGYYPVSQQFKQLTYQALVN